MVKKINIGNIATCLIELPQRRGDISRLGYATEAIYRQRIAYRWLLLFGLHSYKQNGHIDVVS